MKTRIYAPPSVLGKAADHTGCQHSRSIATVQIECAEPKLAYRVILWIANNFAVSPPRFNRQRCPRNALAKIFGFRQQRGPQREQMKRGIIQVDAAYLPVK